jgi:4-hydroxy-tetrahydrodipicolinate synthase
MTVKQFTGTGVAMVTPFNEDGSIDHDGIKKLTRHLVDGGVDYLVVMGTTGENPTLDQGEQDSVLDTVLSENNGEAKVVFGIGGNNTAGLAKRLNGFNRNNVDGILSVSPYYNKPNAEGVYQHYKALSESTDIPIIMYNVPGRTGSNISAENTLRIAELPGIAATKEASGSLDQCMEVIRNKPDDFQVISGDDAYTMPFMSVGMEGVISVVGNAYPREMSAMVNHMLNGEIEQAGKIHYALLPMINAMFADGNPGGVKHVLDRLEICGKTMRPPLAPVNSATKKLLDMAMKELS